MRKAMTKNAVLKENKIPVTIAESATVNTKTVPLFCLKTAVGESRYKHYFVLICSTEYVDNERTAYDAA
jgi:hypothetical protein